MGSDDTELPPLRFRVIRGDDGRRKVEDTESKGSKTWELLLEGVHRILSRTGVEPVNLMMGVSMLDTLLANRQEQRLQERIQRLKDAEQAKQRSEEKASREREAHLALLDIRNSLDTIAAVYRGSSRDQ